MHIPTRLIPSPKGALSGLATQTAGIIVLAATQRYVPNVWGRWAVYIVSAAAGMWYPLTRAVLNVSKLDAQIETQFAPPKQ